MGSYRSKEDDVNRISTSIFVLNFPDSFSAKDLFLSCKQYGHVVDSFIPLKRTKEGKRFGFVHFINVFNVDRLVNNLCTIWVGRFKLHANTARFQKAPLNNKNFPVKSNGEAKRGADNSFRLNGGVMGSGKSFVNVVKASNMVGHTDSPAIVLDEECVYSNDLSYSLMGRVKEFASLTNLKTALLNEGFVALTVRYLGELWVLLEFSSSKSKEAFRDNVGVGSWFSELRQASLDINPDGRIVCVEVKGVPLKLWSSNTFRRIAKKWGDLIDVDDIDENCFHSKRLCMYTKSPSNIFETFKIIFHGKVFWIRAKEVPRWVPELLEDSEDDEQSVGGSIEGDSKINDENNYGDNSDTAEVPETVFDESSGLKGDKSDDPFGLYPLLNKNTKGTKDKNHSPEYPLGFTPNNETNASCGMGEKSVNCNANEEIKEGDGVSNNVKSKGDYVESVSIGRFKKSEAPRTGGSFLSLMEEVVKVGLAQKAKKDWVRELCVKNKVNFLAIQETKMEKIDLFSVRRCWGNFAFDYLHSNSVGNSGGILCVWDPNAFWKNNYTISDYVVIIRGVWLKRGTDLLIIVVYAPHDPRDKHMLWDYLVHVVNQWRREVVIMVDFNEVGYKSDRFGSIFNAQGADVFNFFIANAGLEEVPLGGSAFTWCHKSATKMSKLDRFFVSNNLFNTCPHISAITLERYLSDHRPILLRETAYDFGPVPFRFFHHWFELEGFNTFVSETWNIAPGDTSNGMRNMVGKLKFLKTKIRKWMKDNRCDRKGLSDKLKEELRLVDEVIDKGSGTETVVQKRVEVLNSLRNIDQMHAMDLAQKAKIKWSIEGDENSSFFHGMLNKKRNQMNIRGIMVDGVWKEQPTDVKREFLHHFQNRFDKPVERRAIIEMCYLRSLSNKSPSPDGFTFGFYRQFWPIIEKDVYAAVNHFFNHGDIPDGCNSSFIALIPKVPDANLVKDFRPISLIGSIYKIIAKILANRLVAVLGDIVNEVQSAFITGRQILDGPFILNEVLQWCNKKNKKSLIFKVYFEKAYDSVRWDFLDDVLKKFGFENKWCNWIQCCLKSSRGSIIVNGSPTDEFQFFKGLKQGDPLSPFLFILIMESLHLSFQRVIVAGLFKGIKLNHSLCLSHMFYADDAVFVGQWSDGNINTLMHVLDCFHHASGLRINMSKSKIMGVHVEGAYVNQAASKLGCLVLNSPFSFLGTKVRGAMSRVQAWKEIVENVKARLSKWKMKTFSIGGRLTLLKSVLGSIPIFHMSIFRVLSRVLHVLESIRGHFFNGHEMGSNKATWVKWNNVLTDNKHGGLGVSSLYALNRCLMIKWVWRFFNQKESLWAKVITAIHGDNGKVDSGCQAVGRSCWLSIVNEVRVLKKKGVNIFDFMNLRLGNGDKTKFWSDHWYAGGVLKDLCPRLYALENCKEVTGGVEQAQIDTLVEVVRTINLVPKADRWVWNLESSGEFSVASARKKIDEMRFPIISDATRWVKFVPIKVNILAWKIRSDALPTRINISRRGIDIQSISCPICENGVESSEHLFFSCNMIREIGSKIARWWNINYDEVSSYEEWKTWLISCRMETKLKQMFEGVWYSLWWCVWSYRNKLLFDDKTPMKAIIFDNVISSSFYWCKSRCKASFGWNEWLKNPCLISL
ncbi:RNA-directed DNA polymerase, eukaryota, reverse transcriptase zinc-binding domain protein [Tanacetum coccineum]